MNITLRISEIPNDLLEFFESDDMQPKTDVFSVATKPCKEAHFATYPPALITPCIRAGCPVGGTVLDPFTGSGTTGIVAVREGREFIGIELNPEYSAMANRRIAGETPTLFGAEVLIQPTEPGEKQW